MTTSSTVAKAHEARTHPTMTAWRVHEFGPPEVMNFEQVPRPEPGPGEVLVKVAAAGGGPWDDWIRAGKSALPQPLRCFRAIVMATRSAPQLVKKYRKHNKSRLV